MSLMTGSPAPQPESGRTGPSLLNPDSWRNANQTPDWLKSRITTYFISDKADNNVYSYDLSPANSGRSGRLKDSSESNRRVYFNTMRGYGPPENDIGLPGDIYWDLTSFDRYVLWTRKLEKWVVWNWSDTKPTKTQFELVQHPFVKGRYLWGTPSHKLGWRQPIWLKDNCHISYFDYQDPHMLLKDILLEEESAPEGRVSALNQVRMNVEENRRRVLLENASKKGRPYHPPPDDQPPRRADEAPPNKPKKRLQTHQRSSPDRDPSWTPTGSAKRRRTSGVQVQTATPRRKILSTPISASVSRTSSSSESAQAPQKTRGNEDQSISQSIPAPSPRAARSSSTPPTSPSRQTAPECAVADLDLDNFIDAAYERAMKALQEMRQLEKKELKKVLAHSEQNKRLRIEAEENAKKAEEDAKKARAEATAAKERLEQIHGLSKDCRPIKSRINFES